MKYEVNMNKTYKDINPVDEWGCAYIWNGKIGAEYNYCIEGNENMCAIYFMYEDNKGEWHTDSNRYVHYEIDWNDNRWRQKLIDKMVEVLKEWSDDNGN